MGLTLLPQYNSNYFSQIAAISAPINGISESFLTALHTISLQSQLLLSHKRIVETMDNSETGMNPVEMTITERTLVEVRNEPTSPVRYLLNYTVIAITYC